MIECLTNLGRTRRSRLFTRRINQRMIECLTNLGRTRRSRLFTRRINQGEVSFFARAKRRAAWTVLRSILWPIIHEVQPGAWWSWPSERTIPTNERNVFFQKRHANRKHFLRITQDKLP
jgi:hypothetical protein